ncbi:DUF1071 domain-containing protein [Lentilactobacillus senioris]|uniref:Sak single strand annealing protein n=1 Tax=Lentilactobacillus senioris TaxID=931534 RepID=UPI003D2ACF7A
MAEQNESLFTSLSKINVSDHIESKGKQNLNFVSWVWIWTEIKKIDPEAKREYTQFDEYDFKEHKLTGRKVDYCKTDTGTYVECTVTIKGHSETETLHVMDYSNKAVKDPDQTQINKTKQRCFVKACALQGLGLYIYAGEDLPQEEPKLASEDQLTKIDGLIETMKGLGNMSKDELTSFYLKRFQTDNFKNLSTEKADQVINLINGSISKKTEEMMDAK